MSPLYFIIRKSISEGSELHKRLYVMCEVLFFYILEYVVYVVISHPKSLYIQNKEILYSCNLQAPSKKFEG